jgi:hypothetical protein
MNTDRRAILSLVATGRITASEAERLLVAWNDSRETVWILALSLTFVWLTQIHLREFFPMLMHLFNAQIPALAEGVRGAFSPITELVGGLL